MYQQVCKDPEKAVAIARDIIASLDAQRRQHGRDYYLIPRPGRGYLHGDNEADLQGLVAELEPLCQVCALGSLLLSRAKLYNSVPVNTLSTFPPTIQGKCRIAPTRHQIVLRLEDIFDRVTLDMVEAVFERQEVIELGEHRALLRAAVDYGRQLYKAADDPSPDDIVRVIAQNLIDNNGIFVVPKVEVPHAVSCDD